MDNKVEKLIKESFKDIAIRLCDLNFEDRNSLLAEYREWIIYEIDFEKILMLPYEAYTEMSETEINDDTL
tara:strand:+ start:111 stop:320 length:210 start_codon:yes stop_codon:yes gene_type:complete